MVKTLVLMIVLNSFYSYGMQIPQQFDHFSILPDEMILEVIYNFGFQTSNFTEMFKTLKRFEATCKKFKVLLQDRSVCLRSLTDLSRNPNIYYAIELTAKNNIKNVLWMSAVEKIIKETQDINASGPNADLSPDKYGARTPLMFAARKLNPILVQSLLKAGACVNEKYLDRTALHEAIVYRRTDTVRLLLAAGADPNISDDMKVPPLTLALRCYNVNIMELLVKAGADVNKKFYDGTALHNGAEIGLPSVIKLLLALGADANITDSAGMTPLQRSIERGDSKSIKAFSEFGIEVDEAILGKIAFNEALEKDRDEGVELLQENRSKITRWISSFIPKS